MNGNLVFAKAGLYKITYVIEIPTNAADSVVFTHQLASVPVEGSSVTTHTGTTDYTGEEIVLVQASQTLSLVAAFPAGITSLVVNFASIVVDRIDE